WDVIYTQARAVAADASASSENRRMAAQLLGHEKNTEDARILAGLLGASNPLPLQRTALERLAESPERKVADAVLSSWAGFGPQMRSLVLAETLKKQGWTEALFDKIESGA